MSKHLLMVRSYQLLWGTIPFLYLPLLWDSFSALDLQIHDTYIVLGALQTVIFLSIFLGILGLGYWLHRGYRLSTTASHIHAVVTSCTAIGIILLGVLQTTSRTQDYEFEYALRLNYMALILIFLLLSSQALFIANVLLLSPMRRG